VDKAVNEGRVQPGRYLVLEFDFSSVTRPRNIDEFVASIKKNIHRGLLKFKLDYAKYLGQSFESKVPDVDRHPASKLEYLTHTVDHILDDIHRRGENDHPLWDVRGV